MCFEFKLTFGGEVKKLNLWQNIDPFSMAESNYYVQDNQNQSIGNSMWEGGFECIKYFNI